MKLTNSLMFSSVLILSVTLPAMAASQNWTGGSTADGNWSTAGNWNGAVPGSTSVTSNTDVVTVNAAIANGWGDAGTPIVVDSATQNLGGLSFTLASGNYTIGSTGGNALKLTSAGAIQILAGLTATNAVETINAPLSLLGNYTLANNSANGSGAGAGVLTFGGLINRAVTGASTVTLSGSNSNLNTVSGVIANGSGTIAVSKSGAGTWELGNANTYTGATTISAGTLGLTGSLTGTAITTSGTGVLTQGAASVIGGAVAFTQSSSGTTILAGPNTYTGATTISAGTLGLTGSLTGTAVTTSGTGVLTQGASGVIGGAVAFTQNSSATSVLAGLNTYTGATTISAGAIQLSGANGALALSATAMSLTNAGSLVLDNTTAGGGNNNNRVADAQAVVLNGGSLILKGADDAPTTETLGALTLGSFLNRTSNLSVQFGGTHAATLTAASFTRASGGPTVLVNGSKLGMDSASTASVGRIILTAAPASVGITTATATGINSAAKDTKIVTGLVGEATATTGGLGTATGTANTFVTYQATTGLRPLNPADEFTHNTITTGSNTYITTATTAGATAAINSLVINGGDLTISDGQTLTNTSGAILFASSHSIKPSSSTGTLAFGATEAKITINSGVIAQITAPITGTGGITLSGGGTLQITGATTFPSLGGNASLNLSAGSSLSTGGTAASSTYYGAISGSGSLTKTGTGTMTIGSNSVVGNTANNGFLYSGDINVNAGKLSLQYSSEFNTKSKLTIAGGTVDLLSSAAVFSLFGSTGTLTSSSPSGAASLSIAYTGTDPVAGFTGTVSLGSGNGVPKLFSVGSGDLTFGTLAGGTLGSLGSGKVTAVAIAGNVEGARVATPFSRIVLTGNSGVVNGGNGVTILNGGTLTLAPSAGGGNVVVTGQGLNGTYRVRIAGGGTLQLDKGANTSMEYRVGLITNTNTDFLQFVSANAGAGTLILDPVGGAATLGSATGAKFTILNSTPGKVLANSLVNPTMVVVDNDGTRKGDFVTYNGTGIVGDAGYQQASYTLSDTLAGSSNTAVVKNTVAQTISADTSAFALRNDSSISIDTGKTLTLGAPTSSANANLNATQSPNAGLILNGGTISGAGTLAFGATTATVYTSDAGGTIGATMTGSGGTNAGHSPYNSNYAVSLIKFGAGTLTLSGFSTYAGATVINAGALDVGAISSSGPLNNKLAGSTGALAFGGGVLQGYGTFARGLGSGANQVSWNGINLSYSQMSGGFAAKGGDLTVAIGGVATPTLLTWGLIPTSGSNFMTEIGQISPGGQTGILMFGSNTSDGQVDFQNPIDLGTVSASITTGISASSLYYRIIHVAQGTGTDSAKISGVISSTVVHGLIKDGAGKLVLSGANTYTGDTVVARGALEIAGSRANTPNITVNPGATFKLDSVGGLGFSITNAASSSIGGGGTATFDGTFTLNTAAVTETTGSWTLVNTTSKSFSPSFAVAGFSPKPDGVTWTLTEEGTRLWTFSETTGVLALSVAPTNTFDSWMGGYNFAAFPGADLTTTGDADHDGISNAVEYVIGNHPNQTKVENLPTGTLVSNPAGVPAGDYMKFAYRRTSASVDAGVLATVHYDADLAGTWTPAVNGVDGVHILETANASLPGSDVEVYIPRLGNTKLFGRLSVVVP